MALWTQARHAHKLSIHFLPCAAWHWDRWLWRPAGLLLPRWLCGSRRSHGEQSPPSEIGAREQHPKLLDAVDWELPEATAQHALWFLVAPVGNVRASRSGLGVFGCSLSSVPLGLCQLHLLLTYRSEWCQVHFLVLSLTLAFPGGLRAACCWVGHGCRLHRPRGGRAGGFLK